MATGATNGNWQSTQMKKSRVFKMHQVVFNQKTLKFGYIAKLLTGDYKGDYIVVNYNGVVDSRAKKANLERMDGICFAEMCVKLLQVTHDVSKLRADLEEMKARPNNYNASLAARTKASLRILAEVKKCESPQTLAIKMAARKNSASATLKTDVKRVLDRQLESLIPKIHEFGKDGVTKAMPYIQQFILLCSDKKVEKITERTGLTATQMRKWRQRQKKNNKDRLSDDVLLNGFQQLFEDFLP